MSSSFPPDDVIESRAVGDYYVGRIDLSKTTLAQGLEDIAAERPDVALRLKRWLISRGEKF